MTGKQRWQKCLSTYPRSEDGGCAATFEIIYAPWRAEGGGKGKNDEKNDPAIARHKRRTRFSRRGAFFIGFSQWL